MFVDGCTLIHFWRYSVQAAFPLYTFVNLRYRVKEIAQELVDSNLEYFDSYMYLPHYHHCRQQV